MPYTPYLLDTGSEKPTEMLQQFVTQTQSFLKKLIAAPAEFGLKFIVDIQGRIESAFEVETSQSFATLQQALTDMKEEDLAAVGLTGQSLAAKLTGLNQLSQLVWAGAGKAIKYLLSLVNSILGSLGKLSHAADAIQEMKDLIESTTDFVTDD